MHELAWAICHESYGPISDLLYDPIDLRISRGIYLYYLDINYEFFLQPGQPSCIMYTIISDATEICVHNAGKMPPDQRRILHNDL